MSQFSGKDQELVFLFVFFKLYSVASQNGKVDKSTGFLFFNYLLLSLFSPLEFFTSVLADGFSLEFEWLQVSSSLQDSSQDSGRYQQCCRLDSLYPSANFQGLEAF